MYTDYTKIDYSIVLNYLFTKLPQDNFNLLIEEDKIINNGIHIKAMNQAYDLYIKYKKMQLPKGTLLYRTVQVI